MKIGITFFLTDESLDIVDCGRAVEDLGYESYFAPEHTHIPTSRLSPYPAGGDLPREYFRTHDPLVVLSAMAVTTTRIRLGTGVLLLAQRDPIVTAKALASIDHLSGGRLIVALGGGWNRDEIEAHGTPFARRWRILADRVAIVRALWREEIASAETPSARLAPSWMWPKPAQSGGPPLLMGGYGPGTFARVLEYCDGWMPIPSRVADLGGRISELRSLAAARGRPRPEVTVFGARMDAAALTTLAAQGVDRALFWLRPGTPGETRDALARGAAVAREAGLLG